MFKSITAKKISATAIALSFAMAFQIATVSQVKAASTTNSIQVSDESEIRSLLVGKTLTNQTNSLMLTADYTFEGSYEGQPILGKWMWVSGPEVFCLEVQVPLSKFYCRSPEISGGADSTVRFLEHPTHNGRTYYPNPYPNIWATLNISQ